MSVEENKAIVHRFLEEVWGQGNLSLVDKIVAEDHVHHFTSRDIHGPEGVKQLVSGFRTFMPDVQGTYKDMIAEGDKVMVYFRLSGTDVGGYKDNPPSGKPVEYDGIDIFRLSQGKIAERWGVVDTLSLMYQIDAI
jgi:steroid delta-isomerase-like uncharacterized protein